MTLWPHPAGSWCLWAETSLHDLLVRIQVPGERACCQTGSSLMGTVVHDDVGVAYYYQTDDVVEVGVVC